MTGILLKECCCEDKDEVQACCDEFGDCHDLTVEECLAQGWTPQGKGTECAETDCPVPGDCPQTPEECAGCPDTLFMEASGFGFTACFTEDLPGCNGPCVQVGPWNISRPAEKNQFCNWDIPGANFDFHESCHTRQSIQFFPSGGEIQCIGTKWRTVVRVAVGLLPPVIAFVDFLFETPNLVDCPLGEWTLSNIDINVSPDWEVSDIVTGTVAVS